jgi:hypothetical protein
MEHASATGTFFGLLRDSPDQRRSTSPQRGSVRLQRFTDFLIETRRPDV